MKVKGKDGKKINRRLHNTRLDVNAIKNNDFDNL